VGKSQDAGSQGRMYSHMPANCWAA
jgi:hypothetical protein